MSEIISLKDYQSHLNQEFQIELESDHWISAVLVEASELNFNYSDLDRVERASFSLVFQIGRDIHLPQNTYRIKHVDLGEQQIFLVPIEPDKDGTYYEAVFT